ncbi:MAG: Gfo/Idh/MocA family oxidoreductase [Treponema sp.]|jgi:predicted dehydrogenase|nr:Gfo/Idh/MocA family oxidoreductase [Treponema sp.]
MEKIPVAIIGLGRIASLLEDDSLREKPCTHGGAITANPDCLLVAGADSDEQRRTLFAERWHCPVYADPGAMLKAHGPQMLHIATHPDSHPRYCRLAADYQVPVVVCEKPLADTLTGAQEIAALHRKGGIKIITNHERRYSADYRTAKGILDTERMGRLLSVKAGLYMGKSRRLRNVLWDDGTHLVDVLMFLTGSLMRHEKTWGADLSDKAGSAFLGGYLEPVEPEHTRKAIPFIIEVGAERDHLVFELEFSCEQGRLRIGNGIFEVWESGPSPYAERFRSLRKTDETFDGPTGYFANMVQDAVACVREPGREPRSSALDGLRVIAYLNDV